MHAQRKSDGLTHAEILGGIIYLIVKFKVLPMRKRLLLLGGLMLAQQASGVTIINTDSAVSGGQPAVEQRAAPPLPASQQPEYDERERSAPPLPNISAGANEQRLQWQDQDGAVIDEPPRQAPPLPRPAASSEHAQGTANNEPESEAAESSASNAAPSTQAVDENELTSQYTVEKGWLSDSIDALAYRAGYEMMWSVGQDGKADFQVHRDITLTARSAQEALGQVAEPFPIRLCLFQDDKIAKVIPENQACQ